MSETVGRVTVGPSGASCGTGPYGPHVWTQDMQESGQRCACGALPAFHPDIPPPFTAQQAMHVAATPRQWTRGATPGICCAGDASGLV